ncbi:hypothetical protein GO621_07230 [Mucilaginibacter sp. HMF7410]|uniref:Secretion system C-terminal sorting domain-containing protein n=2 Tax=Mucilaginibacter arboris TaxID=2682090 RepID=A0A7K1SVH3_9SPHI|nr:hypothetical protein [Mucilaginibacter arboris]
MLLHHYLTNTESPTPYWTRDSFMQELNNLGFPTQLRKIALINGSGIGTQLGNFGAMDLHLGVQPTILTRVLLGGIYFIGFKSLVMKVVKSIAQAAGVNIELTKTIDTQAWYTAGYNGRNQVFHGELLGWLVKRTRYASTFSNSIGLDNSMGGYYNAQQQIADGFKEGFPSYIKPFFKPTIFTLLPTHSFIPAKSSLAVTNGSNFGEDFSNRNLVTTTETPFDSYFTPNTNEDHVSLTDCSAKWLTKEIDNQPQAPVGVKYTISGSDQFCTSGTYSIPGLPAGTTVAWSANPNIVSISTTNNVATLNRLNNGTISLTATVSSACGNVPLPSKLVTVGSKLSGYIQGHDMCTNSAGAVFSISPVAGATDYQWAIYPNPQNFSINGNGGSYVDVSNWTSPGGYSMTVTITTPCGTVGDEYSFAVIRNDPMKNCNTGGGSDSFSYYPNPAGNSMTITTSSASTPSADVTPTSSTSSTSNTKQWPFSYKIYNKTGKVLKQGSSAKGEDVMVDTRDLLSDNYFLHVLIGKQEIQKQIVIQH